MAATDSMQAGMLRHRVELQSPQQTRNAVGEAVINWQSVATVWAGIEPLQGREWLADQRDTAEQWSRITIRFRAGVTPTMRVKFGKRIFDIRAGADVDERNRIMRLTCREVL